MSSARTVVPATFIAAVFVMSIGGCLFQGKIDEKAMQAYQVQAQEPVITKIVEPDSKLLAMAKKDKSGNSQYLTYLAYKQGLNGVTIDSLKAQKWLDKAVKQGHLESMYLKAEYYAKSGRDTDPYKAIELFTASAERGHAKAQINLANYYLDGYYIERDYSQAMKWYRSASKQGAPEANYNLGVMYKLGKGVEYSPEKAVSYFRIAAEAGHAAAQYSLGLAYYTGFGVEKNLLNAEEWLQKALANGYTEATLILSEISVT